MHRALKTIVLILGLLGLVLLFGGMAISSKFHVERSVRVQAPAARAYALVVDPHRWKEWTVWNRRDPAMKISYFGAATGVGSGWEWQSASEGGGKMTLTAVTPDQRVAYDLYLPDMDAASTGELRFAAAGDATQVTWLMDGDMGGNPLTHWMALMMDRLVGKDFDAGLANLKLLAEQPQ